MRIRKGGLGAYCIWAVGSLFYLYEYFVRVVPSILSHTLQVNFSANMGQIALAVGMYLMIYSPMQLCVGPLFDVFGARRLLIPASVILAFSCLLPLVPSTHLFYFGLGRLLMGFSSAFAFVGVMYLCTVWFPAKRLAMLSGLTTALGMIGAILAQFFLPHFSECLGWQSTWIISTIFGIITVFLLMIFIPKTQDLLPKPRGKHIWIACKNNLLQVFKNKQSWLIGFLASALFMPLAVFADFWGISYFVNITGCTNETAGRIMAALYLGWMLGAPIVGWLSDTLGTRKKPMWVSGILSFTLFTIIISLHGVPLCVLTLLLFFLGLCSAGQVVGFIACVECNSKKNNASAIAVVNMIVMWLSGIVQTFIGYVMDFFELETSLLYRYSLGIISVVLFVSTVLYIVFGKETINMRES